MLPFQECYSIVINVLVINRMCYWYYQLFQLHCTICVSTVCVAVVTGTTIAGIVSVHTNLFNRLSFWLNATFIPPFLIMFPINNKKVVSSVATVNNILTQKVVSFFLYPLGYWLESSFQYISGRISFITAMKVCLLSFFSTTVIDSLLYMLCCFSAVER